MGVVPLWDEEQVHVASDEEGGVVLNRGQGVGGRGHHDRRTGVSSGLPYKEEGLRA